MRVEAKPMKNRDNTQQCQSVTLRAYSPSDAVYLAAIYNIYMESIKESKLPFDEQVKEYWNNKENQDALIVNSDLATRTKTALIGAGLKTNEQVRWCSDKYLTQIDGIGKATIVKIRHWIENGND